MLHGDWILLLGKMSPEPSSLSGKIKKKSFQIEFFCFIIHPMKRMRRLGKQIGTVVVREIKIFGGELRRMIEGQPGEATRGPRLNKFGGIFGGNTIENNDEPNDTPIPLRPDSSEKDSPDGKEN
jgi:hypothetical protein